MKSHPASRGSKQTDLHPQFAALCWRRRRNDKGQVMRNKHDVLLITSRDTGRWVLPKGWPIPGLAPWETAAQEAWEEAGVQGLPSADCAGHYHYDKIGKTWVRRCIVGVYPLKMRKLAKNFREKGQRELRWFKPRKAARLVAEPELAEILRKWQP